MKSSEVSIKTRSTPALLTIQGQVTKDTTVKAASLALSFYSEAKETMNTKYFWNVNCVRKESQSGTRGKN